jgi:RimJ/RimL family protein N-acetyltransferase
VAELRQLREADGPAVLAFERENRAYFAGFVSDRGDGFFDGFASRYDASLGEQETGRSAFYILVDEDGAVLGRFNLYDVADGTARVGYRVAERVAGRGVATAAGAGFVPIGPADPCELGGNQGTRYRRDLTVG